MTAHNTAIAASWQRTPSDDEMGAAAFLADCLHRRADVDRCKAALGVFSGHITDSRLDEFEAGAELLEHLAEAVDDAIYVLTGLSKSAAVPPTAQILIDKHGLTLYAAPDTTWTVQMRDVVGASVDEAVLAHNALREMEADPRGSAVLRIFSDWIGMLAYQLGKVVPKPTYPRA